MGGTWELKPERCHPQGARPKDEARPSGASALTAASAHNLSRSAGRASCSAMPDPSPTSDPPRPADLPAISSRSRSVRTPIRPPKKFLDKFHRLSPIPPSRQQPSSSPAPFRTRRLGEGEGSPQSPRPNTRTFTFRFDRPASLLGKTASFPLQNCLRVCNFLAVSRVGDARHRRLRRRGG
jgi:hypothetical protein